MQAGFKNDVSVWCSMMCSQIHNRPSQAKFQQEFEFRFVQINLQSLISNYPFRCNFPVRFAYRSAQLKIRSPTGIEMTPMISRGHT